MAAALNDAAVTVKQSTQTPSPVQDDANSADSQDDVTSNEDALGLLQEDYSPLVRPGLITQHIC